MTPIETSMANFCASINPDNKIIDNWDYVNDRPGTEKDKQDESTLDDSEG